MKAHPMREPDPLEWLLDTTPAERDALLASLDAKERREWHWHWGLWRRGSQAPPAGDWRIWLILAGRGFGKTRTGAQWVQDLAERCPDARIALVAANLPEARAVMVEGESGLLSVGAPWRRASYEPSLRRLTWRNGAQAMLYSAAEPDSLRGPQHSHAWCDEVAKWDNSAARATMAWDNLLMGLRLGTRPRVLATTTPRAVPLVRRLLDEAAADDTDVAVTRGSTWDNAGNLPPRFLSAMRRGFASTTLGRQELDGEWIEDQPGALWTRALLETCRIAAAPPLVRVVVAVDPPASEHGDACGIVVCGQGEDGLAYVLADATVEQASPERWARAVAEAARLWRADRVVAESNQGGAMVASVLRAADAALPLRLVHASRGKSARAEPVAALYEAGKVRHAGLFARLEDQLCGMMPGGAYQGPGRSPDRADACVWALTELMLGRAGEPRVWWD